MARETFQFDLGTRPARDVRPLDAESALRILVIGDFSGRAAAGGSDDYAQRRPLAIDVDNFDAVMRRIAPRCAARDGATIDFAALDDFHPDVLYRRLPAFARLRELRERLQHPSSFEDAAAALRDHVSPAQADDAPRQAAAAEKDEDTLARLLGGAGDGAAAPAPRSSPVDAFIRGAVAGHVAPETPRHQSQYLTLADAAIGAEMSAVLHAPGFQALEAAWRGLYWLVSNLELGESLKLFVLDAARTELLRDVTGVGSDLARTATYKTLVDAGEVAGAEPWSVVVGACEFGPGGEDVALLACLGAIAAQCGAAFIGSAAPPLAGAQTFAAADPAAWQPPEGPGFEGWRALRRSAMAPHIALAAPRILLRLPYGRATDRVDAFEYEELGAARAHEAYLWAGGAFACALLIGRAFTERGWDMAPGDVLEVDDLPAHSFVEDGEKRMQACAESFLGERAGQALIERGLVPLLSHAGRNAVRVMRFQSIAEPPQPLAGPWA